MTLSYKFLNSLALPLVKKIYRKIWRRLGISKIQYFCREILLRWAARSRISARIYYSFFSTSFTREQYAYLYGRMKYKENLKYSDEKQRYFLRRNIHRLEKGLLMRPRRKIFALDYIDETVDSYILHTKKHQVTSLRSDEELIWAHDVLTEYFHVVSDHPIIVRAQKQFIQTIPINYLPDRKKSIPYTRNLNQSPPVTYTNFLSLSEQRRSVRWYLQKKIPRILIDQAITAAAYSPSACNRQPFDFRVFDEPNLVHNLAQLPMGTSGYESNIPAIVIIVGRLRAYFDERDRHLIYIDGALAAMSFMFALETLGLSSCPINWPDIENREHSMDKFLALEPDERPIMLISLGYPDPEGKVAFSAKKPLDRLRRYNFE